MYSSPARAKLGCFIFSLNRGIETANIYADSIFHIRKLYIVSIDGGIAPNIVFLRQFCYCLVFISLFIVICFTSVFLIIYQRISLFLNFLQSAPGKFSNRKNDVRLFLNCLCILA